MSKAQDLHLQGREQRAELLCRSRTVRHKAEKSSPERLHRGAEALLGKTTCCKDPGPVLPRGGHGLETDEPTQAARPTIPWDALLDRLDRRLAEEGLGLHDLPSSQEELMKVFMELGFSSAVERMKLRKAVRDAIQGECWPLTAEAAALLGSPGKHGAAAPSVAAGVEKGVAPQGSQPSTAEGAGLPGMRGPVPDHAGALPMGVTEEKLAVLEWTAETCAKASGSGQRPAQLAMAHAGQPSRQERLPPEPWQQGSEPPEKERRRPSPEERRPRLPGRQLQVPGPEEERHEGPRATRHRPNLGERRNPKSPKRPQQEPGLDQQSAVCTAYAPVATCAAALSSLVQHSDAQPPMTADAEPLGLQADRGKARPRAEPVKAKPTSEEFVTSAAGHEEPLEELDTTAPESPEDQVSVDLAQAWEERRAQRTVKKQGKFEAKIELASKADWLAKQQEQEFEERQLLLAAKAEAHQRRWQEQQAQKEEQKASAQRDQQEKELRRMAKEATAAVVAGWVGECGRYNMELMQNAMERLEQWEHHMIRARGMDRLKWSPEESKLFDLALEQHLAIESDEFKQSYKRALLVQNNASFRKHLRMLWVKSCTAHVRLRMERAAEEPDTERVMLHFHVMERLLDEVDNFLASTFNQSWDLTECTGEPSSNPQDRPAVVPAASSSFEALLPPRAVPVPSPDKKQPPCGPATAAMEARRRRAAASLLREQEEAEPQICATCGDTVSHGAMKRHRRLECSQRLLTSPECALVQCEARHLQSHSNSECKARQKPSRRSAAKVSPSALEHDPEHECPQQEVPCPHTPQGCSWRGALGDLEAHRAVCSRAPAVCHSCFEPLQQHAMRGHRCRVTLSEQCPSDSADVLPEHLWRASSGSGALPALPPLADMAPGKTWFAPPAEIHFQQDVIREHLDPFLQGGQLRSGVRVLDRVTELLATNEPEELEVLDVVLGQDGVYACGAENLCVYRLLALVDPVHFALVKVQVGSGPSVREGQTTSHGNSWITVQEFDSMVQFISDPTPHPPTSTGPLGTDDDGGRTPSRSRRRTAGMLPRPAAAAGSSCEPSSAGRRQGADGEGGISQDVAHFAWPHPIATAGRSCEPNAAGRRQGADGESGISQDIVDFAWHWNMSASQAAATLEPLQARDRELAMRRFRYQPKTPQCRGPDEVFANFVMSCRTNGFRPNHRLDDPRNAMF